MLSFRNSLTHPSLSSIIPRQPPCPVDHSFKMYEMFLLIQPFLPAPSCPAVPALCTQSRFLQGPPASSHPCSFSPLLSTPHVQVRQHILTPVSSRWNFLIRDIQWDDRGPSWNDPTLAGREWTGRYSAGMMGKAL